MPGPDVYIVRTGLANLASVVAGLTRAGATAHITENAADVESATHVILPGVGAFKAAMDKLNACNLVQPMQARLAAGRPTACVCLGLQLLCRESEEDPGTQGLAFVPASIRRLPSTVRVPQLGWNEVAPTDGCRMIERGYAYFANSYCLDQAPEGWNVAYTGHGIRFVAAMEKGALLACQFHPELSGPWGSSLIKRWLTQEDRGEKFQC